MAIDTESKRRSTLRVISGLVPLPVSDGLLDINDRVHIWNYRGVTPPLPAGSDRLILDRGNLRGIGTGTMSGMF